MQTLALFLLALSSCPQEPTLPPTIGLTGFTGTEARAFEDLFGQAVLIEFFAHWCAPCARQVPHLNELQERTSDRGLVVLGVTGDMPEDAEPWVSQHGMAFPYAYDPELRLQISLGFHPLPFAILLDPTGAVVWSGKADQLDEKTLEHSLEGALQRPVWEWPAEAAGVRRELADRRYAAALRTCESLEDSELAMEITSLVRRLLETRASIAEAALDRGDLLTAQDIASSLTKETTGLELHARFTALRARIEAEDDGLLAAQMELRALWHTVHQVSSKEVADALLAEIQAFSAAYPDTYLQTEAARYEAALGNLRLSLR